MNKYVFSGFMAGILMATAANAAVTASSYATKGYVDAGLTDVYSKSARPTLNNLDTTGKANVSALGTVDLTKNDYNNNTVGKALVDLNTGFTSLDSDVSGLNSTVSGLNSSVSSLNSSVSELSDDVAGLDTAVSGLSSSVSSLQSDLDALQSQVNELDVPTYSAGTGISISSEGEISVTAFSTSMQSGNTDKTYVIQNGQLVEMDPADTWDPNFFNE